MKKRSLFIPILAASLLAASCAGVQEDFRTETISFADSTKYCSTTLSIELPSGLSPAESLIRDTLVAYLDRETRFVSYEDNKPQFESFAGDRSEVGECVEHYGKGLAVSANAIAAKEESYYPWEYQINIARTYETDRYVVFDCSNYIYLGGAHGGVTGAGPQTFDKATGVKVQKFITDSALMPLQQEFKKGLMQFFGETEEVQSEEQMMEFLFIEDGIIPIPSHQPAPCAEGLTFTYQQYEIAPYASGMPSFTLPFEVVEPYLTAEAKALLCE
ncbi:MAG: DUF3298 and DUF4163 domain-containing protein [Bacteroidales bacterium]|nr:DUF3298 and DUF4163 domain-containing protein [Bacteroidales bacterium]